MMSIATVLSISYGLSYTNTNEAESRFILVSFYFPPNTPPQIYTRFGEMILEFTVKGYDVFVLGDFNIHHFALDEKEENETRDDRLEELLYYINVTGLQSHNTITNHQNKTLDLVLSNSNSIVVTRSISLTKYPDKYHPPLEISFLHTIRTKKASLKQNYSCHTTNAEQRLNFARGDFLKLYNAIRDINGHRFIIREMSILQQIIYKKKCMRPCVKPFPKQKHH